MKIKVGLSLILLGWGTLFDLAGAKE